MEEVEGETVIDATQKSPPQAQGPLVDLALHTLGWKAFQDLCAQVCEEILSIPVSIYREAQDGGQDAVFIIEKNAEAAKIGTVQCKFTSDPKKRLKVGDLASERDSVIELVAGGQADTYYFITNMGIDAPIAADFRKELQLLGVSNPHVYGREWISQQIRASSRLRALVPRIYGLGDLSTILDERHATQTRALLGHLISSLNVYVPTAAHRQAIRILKEHGIVLLLGAPATGKSMLAAILATSALDDGDHRCFQVDSPQELLNQWNPNESGAFYWIDDAFGPNQLREDYVDQWIAMMAKVRTAISGGNRFVLTSRSHIWNAAASKLATRNHPLLKDRTAIVNVGSLSPEERGQILYNHIKAGNQPIEWKTKIKPFLGPLSENTRLLPEIARRLGHISYTSGVASFPNDLNRFVAEPMEFLRETIEELSDAQLAGLVLVFVYRSRLPTNVDAVKWASDVCAKFCVAIADIGNALNQLDGTFVVKKIDSAGETWRFAHPTISDALSSLLGSRPDLTDLYLRGAKAETILSDTICVGEQLIPDAVVIGEASNDLLVSRLLEVDNEVALNTKLFAFLNDRSSEAVFRNVLSHNKSIAGRKVRRSWTLKYDESIRLQARAHKLRILPDQLRAAAAIRLEYELLDNLDSGMFDDEDILALIQPTVLARIVGQIIEKINNTLERTISDTEDEADLDIEPEDNFDDINRFIRDMKFLLFESTDVCRRLEELSDSVNEAISRVAERKDDEYEEWHGEDVVPVKLAAPSGSRSLFSDIDQ